MTHEAIIKAARQTGKSGMVRIAMEHHMKSEIDKAFAGGFAPGEVQLLVANGKRKLMLLRPDIRLDHGAYTQLMPFFAGHGYWLCLTSNSGDNSQLEFMAVPKPRQARSTTNELVDSLCETFDVTVVAGKPDDGVQELLLVAPGNRFFVSLHGVPSATCPHCGGDCPNSVDHEYACDGFLGGLMDEDIEQMSHGPHCAYRNKGECDCFKADLLGERE